MLADTPSTEVVVALKKTVLFIWLGIMAIILWNSEPVRAARYHRHIDVEDVRVVEIFQSFAPEYWTVPAGDISLVVRWFNEAEFKRDNDSLAGPGCGQIDLRIHLQSGERIAVSIRGDELHVSQGDRHYYVDQDQLEQYVREHRAKNAEC